MQLLCFRFQAINGANGDCEKSRGVDELRAV